MEPPSPRLLVCCLMAEEVGGACKQQISLDEQTDGRNRHQGEQIAAQQVLPAGVEQQDVFMTSDLL